MRIVRIPVINADSCKQTAAYWILFWKAYLEWSISGDLKDEYVSVDPVIAPDFHDRHCEADEERPRVEVGGNSVGHKSRQMPDNHLEKSEKNRHLY